MSRYAVGVRVHSGWAAAAVATGSLVTPLILQRGTLTIALGPPWGHDEKLAAIAALLALEQGSLLAV